MSWFVPAFDLWLNVTLAGAALTAVASLAVLVIRQPARKIRVIQLTLAGLLALPALALLPGYPRAGYPRVAWWPMRDARATVAMETKSPPAKPGAAPVSVPQRVRPSALPRGSSSIQRVVAAPPPPATVPVDTVPRATVPAAETHPTQPVVAAPIAAMPVETAPPRTALPAAPAPKPHVRVAGELPSLPDYRLLVITAYLSGVALFALWWLAGRIALWRLVRTATPAEPGIRALLEEVAADHANPLPAKSVRLLIAPKAAQPCAFGWLRPTIVLPGRVVKELNREQLRLALSHEWSHVARGDIRTWMLAGLVRLVHFHQPLVWLLRRELRVSQDYLADAAAAGASSPEDYAELLTALSQMLRPTPLSPGLGIAPRRSDLYRRVVMLVDPSRPLERTIPRRWNVVAVTLGLTLIAGVATLRAEPEAGEPTPAASEPRSLGQPPALPGGSSATPSTAQPAPSLDSSAPVAARPRTRQDLLNDPTDRRDVALELVTVGRKLEHLLKSRRSLQLRLASEEQDPEERQQLEQQLKVIDDGIAETSQSFVELQAHFDAASLKEYARAQAAVADWEQSGDKRRLLEASWAELDQLLKMRDQLFKQAAQQTNSRTRAPYDAHLRLIDAKRVEIAQRIEELLQPEGGRVTPAARQADFEPRLGFKPESLAQMILENEPQYVEFRRTLTGQQQHLDELRASGAPREVLEKAQRSVLQLEEQIEEWKAQRMPALLEMIAASLRLQNGAPAEGGLRAASGPQPFRGRIRPGDILGIEIVGGFPETKSPPTRTVEPDGNVVLGAVYGPASRVNVAGKTLIEAGQTITEQLRDVLKDPQVVVTYEGHDDGVVAEGASADATSKQGKPAPADAEPVVLQPLDTIEIIFALKKYRGHITEIDGRMTVIGDHPPPVNGTYLIEPDGRIALPEFAGRLKVAGLTEEQASATLRGHLATNLFPGTELSTMQVLRRGRAVFADGKQPASDYKIRPGDRLVIRSNTLVPGSEMIVDAEGKVGWGPDVQVAGMTLEQAQTAFRKEVKSLAGTPKERSWPWVVTLGGWREEADPEVIDRIEGRDGDVDGPATEAAASQSKPTPAAEPVVLKSLDTVQIIAPISMQPNWGYSPVTGTYIIEPDGQVPIPLTGGRISLAGLTEAEAGVRLREHISAQRDERKALPTMRVLHRGHAVFAEGLKFADDYKIAAGDKLLVWSNIHEPQEIKVDSNGDAGLPNWQPSEQTVRVAGLTLSEAQAAFRKTFTVNPYGSSLPPTATANNPVSWVLTLGGWREEADPEVIDRIEGTDATQLLRMQEEMQELKAMIRRLQTE